MADVTTCEASTIYASVFGNATDTPALALGLGLFEGSGMTVPHIVSQHRVSITAVALIGANLLHQIARFCVARAESKHPVLLALRGAPLLRLDTPPPGLCALDLGVMAAALVAIASFYTTILVPEGRVYAEGEEELPVIRHRLELQFLAMLVCTGIYYIAHRALKDMVRNKYMLDMQAANLVRIAVKCSWYLILFAIGNWWHIMFTPVSGLREADFANTWLGVWWMNALYVWELLYREQSPESVPHAGAVMFVHHLAACMACWSSMEWFGNDPENMALRKLAPCGIVMSFTEGWCSLIVFIGSLKGCSLRQWSKVMMMNSILGAIVYNMIAIWWSGTIWMNWDDLPPYHRTVSAPLILALTYPAQCAMINMFWKQSAALARQADEAEKRTGKIGDKQACPIVLP